MDLKSLSSLALDKTSIKKILKYQADDIDLENVSFEQVIQALDCIFDLWLNLLTAPGSIDLVNSFVSNPKNKLETPKEQPLIEVVLLLSTYFDKVCSLLFSSKERADLPQAFKIDALKKILAVKKEGEKEEDLQELMVLHRLRITSHLYLASLFDIYFLRLLKKNPTLNGATAVFEQNLHEHTKDFHHEIKFARKSFIRDILEKLLDSILEKTCLLYEESYFWNKKHIPGPFSSIRLEELSPIAGRHPKMIDRYGSKHLEKVFEHKLALLMQSFGLYVVSTKIGKSTVDLICISSSENEKHTFLIEAKTSKNNYALPKSDQRALLDYVKDTRRNLSSLPPLTCVIIVANSPAKTVIDKIRSLEQEAKVPFRFIGINEIASLREMIVGSLQTSIFTKELLRSDPIIKPEFVSKLAQAHKELQQAHADFVETMFNTHNI